jgi:probable phosphoglycerate mutase
MSITLIRHGQTDWNIEKRMQGQLDININPKGVQQIQLLSNRLENFKNWHRIYTSPLERAKNSAKILGEKWHLPVEEVEDLKELGFGDWQGMTYIEIERKYPDQWATWHSQAGLTQFPSAGKTIVEMNRVIHCINQLIEKNQEPIVVVTHGTIIEIFHHHFLGISPENMAMESRLIGNGTAIHLEKHSKNGG